VKLPRFYQNQWSRRPLVRNKRVAHWPNRDPLGEAESPCLYCFIGNNPVGQYDLNGLYGDTGHFYTIYAVAIAKGYSQSDAFALAYFAELPDKVDSYSAWANGWQWGSEMATKNDWLRQIQELLHSLHGGDAIARRDCLRGLLKDTTLTTEERGLILHAFGDSYAHSYVDPNTGKTMAYSFPFGHGAEDTDPDQASLRPELYSGYVNDLFNSLPSGTLSQTPNLIQSIINENAREASQISGPFSRPSSRGIHAWFNSSFYQSVLNPNTFNYSSYPGNHPYSAEMADVDLRNYIINQSGYSSSYHPELGNEYSQNRPQGNEDLGTSSGQTVQHVMDLIKAHCCAK